MSSFVSFVATWGGETWHSIRTPIAIGFKSESSISTLSISCYAWTAKQFTANADTRHRRHCAGLLWRFLGWTWSSAIGPSWTKTGTSSFNIQHILCIYFKFFEYCVGFLPAKRTHRLLYSIRISTVASRYFWCFERNGLSGIATRDDISIDSGTRARTQHLLHIRCWSKQWTDGKHNGRPATFHQLGFATILR